MKTAAKITLGIIIVVSGAIVVLGTLMILSGILWKLLLLGVIVLECNALWSGYCGFESLKKRQRANIRRPYYFAMSLGALGLVSLSLFQLIHDPPLLGVILILLASLPWIVVLERISYILYRLNTD